MKKQAVHLNAPTSGVNPMSRKDEALALLAAVEIIERIRQEDPGDLSDDEDAWEAVYTMRNIAVNLLAADGTDVDLFFKTARESSYDRPSAFQHWAGARGWDDAPELAMHAEYERDDTLAYLNEKFGGSPPAELMREDWDT